MDQSIILVTWIKPDLAEVSRQVIIPHDIDPLDISEDDLRRYASDQGFNIFGDLSWEVLQDNSEYSYKYGHQRDALKLAKRIDHLMDEIQDAINELYEIANNR